MAERSPRGGEDPATPPRRVRISSRSPTRSPVRLATATRSFATPPRARRSPYASPARSPYRSPPTTPRGSAAVTVLGKRVPRVSLPILWWLQARTRATLLEKRLMERAAPGEATALRAHVASLEEAVRRVELHAAQETARAAAAEAKIVRLEALPPPYPETPEGERRLTSAMRDADARLDELRRGALDALRVSEAKLADTERDRAAADAARDAALKVARAAWMATRQRLLATVVAERARANRAKKRRRAAEGDLKREAEKGRQLALDTIEAKRQLGDRERELVEAGKLADMELGDLVEAGKKLADRERELAEAGETLGGKERELVECRRQLAVENKRAAWAGDRERELEDCRRQLVIEKRRAETAPRREKAAADVALRAQKAVVALNARCDDFCRDAILRAHDDVVNGLDAWLRDNRQPLLDAAGIYAARRRPFSRSSREAPIINLTAPMEHILAGAARPLPVQIAPLVAARDARNATGCDAALSAVMTVAYQRHEARFLSAHERLAALHAAASQAAAAAAGAVGAVVHPAVQRKIINERDKRRTAVVAQLNDLRTSLRMERIHRKSMDFMREAALAASMAATARLGTQRVAQAVRVTADQASAAHTLALEDHQRRHRRALDDAIAACEARHAEALDHRRRRDVALAASLRGATQRAAGGTPQRDSLAEAAAAVEHLYQREAARGDRHTPARRRAQAGAYAAPPDAARPPPPPRRPPPPPPRPRARRPPPPPASRPRGRGSCTPSRAAQDWDTTVRTAPLPFKHVPGGSPRVA
jgi:hypothetical protein